MRTSLPSLRSAAPVRASLRALVAAGIAVVALVGCTPATGGGGGTPPVELSHCPTPAAGEVRVAVVVDSLALTNNVDVVCVVVPAGSTGITALQARAARIGTTPPRFHTSGLLCAIDGVPVAPYCGTPGPTGIEYWSYWIGGSSWTYANVGPGFHTVTDGAVEGWRFIDGGANAAPRVSSSSFQDLTS